MARTTYKTTKFVRNAQQDITQFTVKSTSAVGRATVKVVTWPVRAIRGGPGSSADPLANHGTDPTGPEPIIVGALPGESAEPAVADTHLDPAPDLDPSATRVVASDSEDPASLR